MSIFLLILKILGIILLSIIGLFLLIIILVLFCPVRYRVRASYNDKDVYAYAKASWLGIVRVLFEFKDEADFKVKILFFNLIGSNKKHKKKNDKKEKESECRENITQSESESAVISTAESDGFSVSEKESVSIFESESLCIDSDISSSVSESEINIANSSETTDSTDSKSITSDSVSTGEDIANDSHSDSETDKSDITSSAEKDTKTKLYDKIKKVIGILQSDRFKKTYPIIKQKVFKLLRILLPRKWNIEATLGFEDPSKTGQVLMYTSLLYPWIRKHIRIIGDFENKTISAHGDAKGHITGFSLLIAIISLYFDKNIKKLLKDFKEAYNG